MTAPTIPAVDPAITAELELFPISVADLSLETLPTVRDFRSQLVGGIELSDAVERSDLVIPGPTGAPDVAVRVHRPKDVSGDLPCVYSIHGGGYVIGSYDMDDLRFDNWCPRLGAVGVSVEYRLAPETAYPGPLEDCYAGLKWVHDNADTLGIDRGRIGVSGASAGGGLAAGLALLARDRGDIPLAFQMLIYPMIDDRRVTPSSRWDVPIWSPANNEFGWRCYLGDLFGTDDVPAYAAASRAENLEGLPPTGIWVGTADGFCDEDIIYAQRLIQAGVPTELHVYPGAPHAFDMFPSADVSKRCRREMLDWLRSALS
ncbi:MAG TPA: alpha/beta hydrolase [Acidimicrobiales bacterium]